jgi:hypothetical protein
MTRIIELFGIPTNSQRNDWGQIVDEQVCPFTEKRCYKTRKSNPDKKKKRKIKRRKKIKKKKENHKRKR